MGAFWGVSVCNTQLPTLHLPVREEGLGFLYELGNSSPCLLTAMGITITTAFPHSVWELILPCKCLWQAQGEKVGLSIFM